MNAEYMPASRGNERYLIPGGCEFSVIRKLRMTMFWAGAARVWGEGGG